MIKNDQSPQGVFTFFREVAKYFMDFLETDFHKRRLPKRVIRNRNSDNLLVGIQLKKYETLIKPLFRDIASGFTDETSFRIAKNQFKTKVSKNVLELVKLQISKINQPDINKLVKTFENTIDNNVALYGDNIDECITITKDDVSSVLSAGLIQPFMHSLTDPLKNSELGDEEDLRRIETDLEEIFMQSIEAVIANYCIVKKVGGKINSEQTLKTVFSLKGVLELFTLYFEDLKVADLFLEINELTRNQMILEKQELYLYFGEIVYQQNKYPIFYMPIATSLSGESLELIYDSQIFVNKKALEYIAQEVNKSRNQSGQLQEITDRIIYVSDPNASAYEKIKRILIELSQFFETNSIIQFDIGEDQISKSSTVQITNGISLMLFDKSDEALVNDYEEIIQSNGLESADLSTSFNGMLEDFLTKNPLSVVREVEQEWENLDIPDKLVFDSPIPLNSEQIQILRSLDRPNSKFIVVEGPPGTGKSHTITAIIFDQIQKSKNVLVLSDKKEALDVVEKNISSAMNRVRTDQKFQNPILRLGKTGSTYSQILSKSSISDIRAHYKVVAKNFDDLSLEIQNSINDLKSSLESEIVSLGEISLAEIEEQIFLEGKYEKYLTSFDENESKNSLELVEDLESIFAYIRDIDIIKESREWERVAKLFSSGDVVDEDEEIRLILTCIQGISAIATKLYGDHQGKENVQKVLHFVDDISDADLDVLKQFEDRYRKLKKPLIGYSLSGSKLATLDSEFCSRFNVQRKNVSQNLDLLSRFIGLLQTAKFLTVKEKIAGINGLDVLKTLQLSIVSDQYSKDVDFLTTLKFDNSSLKEFANRYPVTSKALKITQPTLENIRKSSIFKLDKKDFDGLMRVLVLREENRRKFDDAPVIDYEYHKKSIEDLVATKVTFEMDGRVIDFNDNYKNDAETLRQIIKNKQKFPKDHFSQVSRAFPCILSGIRDYADYIPLQREMFDLVIIDEASQVSLAQAFPALIRAKKVLVLGDKKQFSNVKANQARSDLNAEYLSVLSKSFKQNVSTDAAMLTRLKKFNVKTSVLEFFEFICNYEIQLKKHFRGYKEIISYSNKYFYNNSLEVMKIRGVPIDEVIKFTEIKSGEEDEIYQNTNMAEVKFVIQELLDLLKAKSAKSVGIITPHTNQQRLFVEEINKLSEKDDLYESLNLKIMTFDTCQGEERDTIFYSMVANQHSDKLWGIFIKDLSKVDIEEDGQVKAQRLNVGLSRGRETIHFVISKPLEEFSGSIGEALRHYKAELELAKKEKDSKSTDPRSAMEPVVLNWFYQTELWKSQGKFLDLIPSFEIGKYLKQLDSNYTHPMYKVDFLLVYRNSEGIQRKIIIEYDGFYEHFSGNSLVNSQNYRDYMSEADLYREKVLESYGYAFVRINKFNVGKEPVKVLNDRLLKAIFPENVKKSFISTLQETVQGLQTGDVKECAKCQELKPLKEFKDPNLQSGLGRICLACKKARTPSGGQFSAKKIKSSSKLCPLCGSAMYYRSGRNGWFYGCVKYPYCKGTRSR